MRQAIIPFLPQRRVNYIASSACTGDWELNTIRTVNESVPVETRLNSCNRVIEFVRLINYHVHRVYSVHANDRREGVDFPALIADTREDRKLW